MDEAKKAATLPTGIPGPGPPGSPPTWGGVMSPGGTAITMPRCMSSPPTLDPYAIRPLPSLPKTHTPPPGLPRVKDIYNNPMDLGPITESPPSQVAPQPPQVPLSTSQEIIDEIKKEEMNKSFPAPPDSDDETCNSIAAEDEPDYKNTSLPEDQEQEPPYKNVAERTHSTDSGYQKPSDLRLVISGMSAEDHPKPPAEPPEPDDDAVFSFEDQQFEPVDDKMPAHFPEPEQTPPYANVLNPSKAIPRPPSLESDHPGGSDDELVFENRDVFGEFVEQDLDGVKLAGATPATHEFFL